MSRLIIAALAVVVFLSGCARVTVKVASAPVGGSRADGTITLAYEYLAVVTPEVDWEEMQKQAQERCARWGYLTAESVRGRATQLHRAGPQWVLALARQYRVPVSDAKSARPAKPRALVFIKIWILINSRLKASQASKEL